MIKFSALIYALIDRIKLAIKLDKEDVKEFIYRTHIIEGENVSRETVDGWVEFALGDAKKPPEKKHKGIEGHLHILTSGHLPSSIENVLSMYKTIGEVGVLRGGGQKARPKGDKKEYTTPEKIGDELIEWINKGKMGTFKSHAEFEKIHPCNDGNGRIGRLILLLGGYPIKELNKLISKKSKYLDKIESF